MSRWRDEARRLIAELTKDLPADATIEQRRKALWGKGWRAHQGTSWGRKMWGKEVRAHLAYHGDASGRVSGKPVEWPSDIAFPWKGGGNP